MSDTPSTQPAQPQRWIRVFIRIRQNSATSAKSSDASPEVPLPLVEFPNELSVGPNDPRRELAIIRKCIYCGATERQPNTGIQLSEEHFVSEGLGSRLVLLEASCDCCATKTSNIERVVLQQTLLVPRIRLGVRRKKRKRSERLFPVAVNQYGDNVIRHVTIDKHPSILLLPSFNHPGLTIDRPIGQSGFQGAFVGLLTDLPKPGFPEFASPPVDTAAFCQLVAKIAHGFAVLELGLDGFSPMLPELVLKDYDADNSLSWFHLIGGDPRDFAPSETQHVLGWNLSRKKWSSIFDCYSTSICLLGRSCLLRSGRNAQPRAVSTSSRHRRISRTRARYKSRSVSVRVFQCSPSGSNRSSAQNRFCASSSMA